MARPPRRPLKRYTKALTMLINESLVTDWVRPALMNERARLIQLRGRPTEDGRTRLLIDLDDDDGPSLLRIREGDHLSPRWTRYGQRAVDAVIKAGMPPTEARKLIYRILQMLFPFAFDPQEPNAPERLRARLNSSPKIQ